MQRAFGMSTPARAHEWKGVQVSSDNRVMLYTALYTFQ